MSIPVKIGSCQKMALLTVGTCRSNTSLHLLLISNLLERRANERGVGFPRQLTADFLLPGISFCMRRNLCHAGKSPISLKYELQSPEKSEVSLGTAA